jgi:hypothetical protein
VNRNWYVVIAPLNPADLGEVSRRDCPLFNSFLVKSNNRKYILGYLFYEHIYIRTKRHKTARSIG